jgi:hypothetical protein
MAFSTFNTFNNAINSKTKMNTNLWHLAYYNFENDSTEATDSWNSNNAINYNTSITTTRSKYGTRSCMSGGTVGSVQYIKTPDISYIPANGLSISLWMYRTGTATSGDTKVFEFTQESIMLWMSNNGSLINFANGPNVSITTLNIWNNIIITIASTGAYIVYLNGTNKATGTIASLVSPLPSGNIGRSLTSAHNSFFGNIDDFRIYNTVLTSTNVSGIYNNTYDPA